MTALVYDDALTGLPVHHPAGLNSSQPLRLSQVRQERRPGTVYASLPQCTWELRNAQQMYALNDIPHLNSAFMSVEEISATILQRMDLQETGIG